jgi:hypothetical protein
LDLGPLAVLRKEVDDDAAEVVVGAGGGGGGVELSSEVSIIFSLAFPAFSFFLSAILFLRPFIFLVVSLDRSCLGM